MSRNEFPESSMLRWTVWPALRRGSGSAGLGGLERVDSGDGRSRDCRNRRMRFQHRDYDNGRYLDEPNFRSNFIHQSTYSTVKSSLVQAQGNTSLKYIESQSRLLLTCLRLPNTTRQAKRAEGHRQQAKRQRGRQENFCMG